MSTAGVDGRDMWDLLAVALEYPRAHTVASVGSVVRVARSTGYGELAGAAEELLGWLRAASDGVPEEEYTALFDLKPTCTLHIGYQILGDTYARGELLSGLGGELKRAGLSTRGELPDYLPVLLRLMARQREEDRSLLVHGLLIPGLERMLEKLGDVSHPYVDLLRLLPAVLEEAVECLDDFVLAPPAPSRLPIVQEVR